MNKEAYEIFKLALLDSMRTCSDKEFSEFTENSVPSRIANEAARVAADKGAHWSDYPEAWHRARADTIWS